MRLLPNNKDIGWTPYLWLVYAANLPLYAFLGNANARTWTLSLLSMAVFLALYFRGYWVKDRKLLAIIVALGLLGVVMAPVNPGASVYFVYASAFGGELGNTTKAVWVIACLMLAIVAVTLIFHLPGYFWISGLIFTAMVGAVDIHYAERRRENKKLLLAQEEVAQVAQIAERERIGRDLHDVLGHTLSLIVLKSELASKLADKDPQRAAQEIRDVERISRDTLAQVRSTVRGYQSRSLVSEAEQARAALRAAGVQVQCDFNATKLPAAQEGVLALALREAVTNVIRHAKATACDLTLREENGACRLEIKDNGCGSMTPEGSGLSGMRQRVESLGGKLQREISEGTRLIITLPMVHQ